MRNKEITAGAMLAYKPCRRVTDTPPLSMLEDLVTLAYQQKVT